MAGAAGGALLTAALIAGILTAKPAVQADTSSRAEAPDKQPAEAPAAS